MMQDYGKISICNYDVYEQREEALKHISVMIEGPSLYPNFTVKKQLRLNKYLRDVSDNDLTNSYNYLDKNISLNKKYDRPSDAFDIF